MTRANDCDLGGALGLARRAGSLAWGARAVEKAVGRGQAEVVVLAEDAADRTRARIQRLSQNAGIPVVSCSSSDDLGGWIGLGRVATCAVTDANLARSIARGDRPSKRR